MAVSIHGDNPRLLPSTWPIEAEVEFVADRFQVDSVQGLDLAVKGLYIYIYTHTFRDAENNYSLLHHYLLALRPSYNIK